MRRIGMGMVAVAVLAILCSLVGASLTHGPRQASSAVSDAPRHDAVVSQNQPTLAPPQPTLASVDGPQFDRQPRGQVIYVCVEAEKAP